MSRSAAMKVVKFLLVIGLMALVFRSVQWDDRLLTKSAVGEAVEETVSIRGAWSSDRVVVIDSSGNERALQPGKQADGSELELAPGAKAQDLLAALVGAGAQIERFELVRPSLHRIFLEKVGATNVEAGMSGHG